MADETTEKALSDEELTRIAKAKTPTFELPCLDRTAVEIPHPYPTPTHLRCWTI